MAFAFWVATDDTNEMSMCFGGRKAGGKERNGKITKDQEHGSERCVVLCGMGWEGTGWDRLMDTPMQWMPSYFSLTLQPSRRVGKTMMLRNEKYNVFTVPPLFPTRMQWYDMVMVDERL